MKNPYYIKTMNHTPPMRKLGAKSRVGTRIYKKTADGVFFYRPTVDGKQHYFPLGYDKRKALDLADKIRAAKTLYPIKEVIEMYHKKRFQEEKDPTPKVSEVEKRLSEHHVALGINKKTVKDYMDALKRIIRVVTNEKDVDDFDCGELNESFINGYKMLALAGLSDEGKIQSRKRTINTKLRSAKAIFNHRIYDGFCIDFNESLQETDFFKKLGKQYKLPPMKLIQNTFDLWHSTNGDVHTLMGVSLIFGLRRNEIFHARRDWFSFEGEKARVNVEAEKRFKPKGGHEGHSMGNKALAKRILNKASGDDYLINNRADNGRPVYSEALELLRDIGWDRPSPLHELRKLFGSFVSTTESLYTSQKWCRHADSKTTSESYSDLIEDKKVISRWVA
ncbi:hypothetical protein N8920_05565 [Opitutales bacterium]|nr:hypothetical protein [Opitutales bacterium]